MKRLLLAGGGHAHVEVLRRLARRNLRNAELLLVTPSPLLIYTGMLPGLIAGHYRLGECTINLAALGAKAGCQWIAGSVAGIEPQRNAIRLHDGRQIAYDVLSLDVGSVAQQAGVRGAERFTVPARPMEGLVRWWKDFLNRFDARPNLRIGIVGGGAGGVELALAMHHRLTFFGGTEASLFLVTEGPTVVPDHHPKARIVLEQALQSRGIEVYTRSKVTEAAEGRLRVSGAGELSFDALVWVAGAGAPEWIEQTALSTDDRGFVAVHDTLQSTSHPNVFAAGDVADLVNHPRPKAGVFAVREGPILERNLVASLSGRRLASYQPQKHALALISTGARHAVASRGSLVFAGAWVWRWKDWIDRRFVARYRV
jgi:selenide, water dikinase